jgi:hypothetical protein
VPETYACIGRHTKLADRLQSKGHCIDRFLTLTRVYDLTPFHADQNRQQLEVELQQGMSKTSAQSTFRRAKFSLQATAGRVNKMLLLETWRSELKPSILYLGLMSESAEQHTGEQAGSGYKLTRDQAELLLEAACNFQGRGIQAREECREMFRRKEREDDNTLRILVDGQIAALETVLSKPIQNVDKALSYQIGLVTSYTRTHFLVTDFILNGDLIEAITLIRKQLESLARLHELDHRPLDKLQGVTPNVGMFFRHGGGEMYGRLSEVAHFSKPRVSELMHVIQDGERIGPSLHPVFSEHSFACLDMHHFVAIYFLVWIVDKLKEWYPATDGRETLAILMQTIVFAKAIGVIRFAEGDKTQAPPA